MKLLRIIPLICIYTIAYVFIAYCTSAGMYMILDKLTVLPKTVVQIFAILTVILTFVFIRFNQSLKENIDN
jgi:hypothetical protein